MTDTAVGGQRTVLRVEEKVRSHRGIQTILSVSPVITERQSAYGHQVDGLCLRRGLSVNRSGHTGEAAVVRVDQGSEVRREQVSEIRNLRYRSSRGSRGPEPFQLTCCCIPINSRLGVDQVVERHHIAIRDQVVRVSSDVGRLDKKSLRQLALIR